MDNFTEVARPTGSGVKTVISIILISLSAGIHLWAQSVNTPETNVSKGQTPKEKAEALIKKYGDPKTMTITAEQLAKALLDQMNAQSPNKEINQYYANSQARPMPESTWKGIEKDLAVDQAKKDVIDNAANDRSYKMNLEDTTAFAASQGASGGAGSAKENTNDPLAHFFGKNFHLNQSSTVVQEQALPAQISWLNNLHGRPTYNVDAAFSDDITLFPPPPRAGVRPTAEDELLRITFSPAVEAHISDNPAATQNSISVSAPFKVYADTGQKNWLTSNYVYFGPSLQMDYKAQTEAYGATLLYSPTIPAIGIGGTATTWKIGGVTLYPEWRPYLGMEAGYAEQSKPGDLRQGDYDRLVFQVHAELFIAKYCELSADYYYRLFLSDGPFTNNDVDGFSYIQASAVVYLDDAKHFSFGLTYKDGQTSPQFQRVQSLTAFVGLRF